MRRWLLFVALLLITCQTIAPRATELSASRPQVSTEALQRAPVPSPESPSEHPTLQPSPTAGPVEDHPYTVRFHPDGQLYVGDQISIEVIAPKGVELEDRTVDVRLISPEAAPLAAGAFGSFGIGGRNQATFYWAWDTRQMAPGAHEIEFVVQPDGLEWVETVWLKPQEALQLPEAEARWAAAESDCCLIRYVQGVEPGRDLDILLQLADEQAEAAERALGAALDEPVRIVFLPRLLGHGGFAGGEIYISYLDRNYAGSNPPQVIHHELVHMLDRELAGELRPTLLVEGLAVYLSGGHFKYEPLLPRAAALLDLGWYLPLGPLFDDFYFSQHEIGYLQAGALVEYLVDTHGWPAFDNFYRDIHPLENGAQSQAVDLAFQRHFGITLAELEEQFLAALRRYPLNPDLQEDVRLTVQFYDTVRRYQQQLDPSAYFLTAWLPSVDEMRRRGIVADYIRHPATAENIALESLLVAADQDLRRGRYFEAESHLVAVNAVLDAMAQDPTTAFGADPLAQDYFAVVRQMLAAGYEPKAIRISGDHARALAGQHGVELVSVELARTSEMWEIVSTAD